MTTLDQVASSFQTRFIPPLGSNVVTVDGFDRQGHLATERLLKVPKSRLVQLRNLQHNKFDILRSSLSRAPPVGMSQGQFQALMLKRFCDRHRGVLPRVVPSDYDLPLDIETANIEGGGIFAGTIPWLVGGNAGTQLPTLPASGFYELGTLASAPPVAGVDIITDGTTRIRINGDASNDPTYEVYEAGKVIIANGFIEQEAEPALVVPISGPALPPGSVATVPPFIDLYLERASNVYDATIPCDFGTLVPADFVPDGVNPISPFFEADPTIAGARIVYINNIFLGNHPPGAPTSTIGYNAAAVTPITGLPLGINSFNFLLKVLNPCPTPIALYFNIPGGTGGPPPFPDVTGFRFAPIYSNASGIAFVIPAGGAGFFQMRVEEGQAYIMLDNVIYSLYTDPIGT